MIWALTLLTLAPVKVAIWTDPVGSDADDPAIVYAGNESLIIGTDKEAAPKGGLYVFNLAGKQVFRFEGLNRPNNVDVVARFAFGRESAPMAVTTERLSGRLRVFRVDRSGSLRDVTGKTTVFGGTDLKEPMGIALHENEGRTKAYITPKIGGLTSHIEEGELVWNPQTKRVDYLPLRHLGRFSGIKETESIVVDDASGSIFYSDEGHGIWRYDGTGIETLLQNKEHTGDHEGLAVWGSKLVSADQRTDSSVFWVYDKVTLRRLGAFSAPLDDTDGIEICDKPMGPNFPKGIMVGMNSKGKNFAIIDLREIPF